MNIRKVSKDESGVITHVLIKNSIVEVSDVVDRINNGESFYVTVNGNSTSVRLSPDKKHIATTPDGKKCNNLDNLPTINYVDRLLVKIVEIWNKIWKKF